MNLETKMIWRQGSIGAKFLTAETTWICYISFQSIIIWKRRKNNWVKGARARNSYNLISIFHSLSWLNGFKSTWYLELGSSELPKIIFQFSFRVTKIWRSSLDTPLLTLLFRVSRTLHSVVQVSNAIRS